MAPSSPVQNCIRVAQGDDEKYISISTDGGASTEHEQGRAYGKKRERRDSTHGLAASGYCSGAGSVVPTGSSSTAACEGNDISTQTHVRSLSADDGFCEDLVMQNLTEDIPAMPPPPRRDSSGYSPIIHTKSRRTQFTDVKTSIHKVKSSPSFLSQLEEALVKEGRQEKHHEGNMTIPDEALSAKSGGDHTMTDGSMGEATRNRYPKAKLGRESSPSMNRVHSMPLLALEALQVDAQVADTSAAEQHQCELSIDAFADTNPEGYMQTIIESHGYPSAPIETLSVTDFFLEHTPEQIAAYDAEVTGAVRSDDIDALRRMLADGKPLQCSNRFGESIVHMACRQGSLTIVKFLLEEAHVTVRVRDDVGRTPLHDACWSSSPSFELIKMLIERDPDLLLLCDKRGHTPLAYVRRNNWGEWCRFLNTIRDDMIPREVVLPKVSF